MAETRVDTNPSEKRGEFKSTYARMFMKMLIAKDLSKDGKPQPGFTELAAGEISLAKANNSNEEFKNINAETMDSIGKLSAKVMAVIGAVPDGFTANFIAGFNNDLINKPNQRSEEIYKLVDKIATFIGQSVAEIKSLTAGIAGGSISPEELKQKVQDLNDNIKRTTDENNPKSTLNEARAEVKEQEGTMKYVERADNEVKSVMSRNHLTEVPTAPQAATEQQPEQPAPSDQQPEQAAPSGQQPEQSAPAEQQPDQAEQPTQTSGGGMGRGR